MASEGTGKTVEELSVIALENYVSSVLMAYCLGDDTLAQALRRLGCDEPRVVIRRSRGVNTPATGFEVRLRDDDGF